jgi:hypothetical protein
VSTTASIEGAAPPVADAARPGRRRAARSQSTRDGWVYLALALLTAGAWWFTSLKLFSPGDDAGYWLGVVGGTIMLFVFAYPMRKHFRFMQHWGAGKYWFIVHMMVGVVGPVLILIHSTFHIGSINGGVALFSMVAVALSGVVGRFVYVRVHSDLQGHKLTLDELRSHIAGGESVVPKLKFAPEAQRLLLEFERVTLANKPGWIQVLLGSWMLTWRRWNAQRQVRTELRIGMMALAQTEGWNRKMFRRRLRAARELAADYLTTVQRIAEFSGWERVFALWHVAHVPFVYMMVLSAVAHVIAVHAY